VVLRASSLGAVHSRRQLDEEEDRFATFNLEKSRATAPRFGRSDTPIEAVHTFYGYWEAYSCKISFEWVNEHDPAEVCVRVLSLSLSLSHTHTHARASTHAPSVSASLCIHVHAGRLCS
jgi:hypothetical protein